MAEMVEDFRVAGLVAPQEVPVVANRAEAPVAGPWEEALLEASGLGEPTEDDGGCTGARGSST